jgi:acetyl esterase
MPLNAQAQALLEVLESRGGKPINDLTVGEARAAEWGWLDYMGEPEHVAGVRDTYIAGPTCELHVRVYSPSAEGPLPCLVWFHGGGWTVANLELADRPIRSLANTTGCVVVAVNYQKAPEHPYPAALDDCFAAAQWAVEHADELGIDPTKVGVGGDSAGGNLAAAAALKARDLGAPDLAFQLLLYPAVDPDMDYPSARDNAEGYGLTTAGMRWFWDNYAPDPAQREDPLAAPIRAASFEGLPPAIVVTAEYDPLRDEGQLYADRLEQAGVHVVRRAYPGTIHGFLWIREGLPDDFRSLMDDLGHDVPEILAERPQG